MSVPLVFLRGLGLGKGDERYWVLRHIRGWDLGEGGRLGKETGNP